MREIIITLIIGMIIGGAFIYQPEEIIDSTDQTPPVGGGDIRLEGFSDKLPVCIKYGERCIDVRCVLDDDGENRCYHIRSGEPYEI